MQRQGNERSHHGHSHLAHSHPGHSHPGHSHPGHAEHGRSDHGDVDDELIIDCDRCRVRGDACRDCVVSVLLGPPPELRWDETERRAVDALADGGMVPRLRLVPVEPVETGEPTDDGRRAG